MAETSKLSTELRVAIRCVSTAIPGLPSDRGKRVADDVARWKLGRSFSYDADFVHLPGEFDGEKRQALWFLCDLNVGERREASDIPLEFWQVDYDGEAPKFKQRLTQGGVAFANRYAWGGHDGEWKHRLQQRELEADRSNAG